jgi:hypothetical protein
MWLAVYMCGCVCGWMLERRESLKKIWRRGRSDEERRKE